MRLEIRPIKLPLKVNWKISRNSSVEKQNYIISVRGDENILGEVAPNIRYRETPEIIEEQFQKYFSQEFETLFDIKVMMNIPEICHSLKFGIDQIIIQLEVKETGKSFEDLLKIKKCESARTSYSIPIMDPAAVEKYVKGLAHYRSLKLKVDADCAYDLIREVANFYSGTIRLDANEAWTDLSKYLDFEECISHLPVEFVEQPFPVHCRDEYKELFRRTQFPIMADESIEDVGDFNELKSMFHMINVKLMKAGTIRRALELIQQAKAHRMKVMLGCMIETSLGISTALRIGAQVDFFDLDGFLLLKEDPFNLIQVKGDILTFKN